MVRGAAALAEPGVPPKNEDIISPNGFWFAVRGVGRSKYSVPSSSNTYEIPRQYIKSNGLKDQFHEPLESPAVRKKRHETDKSRKGVSRLPLRSCSAHPRHVEQCAQQVAQSLMRNQE